MGRTFALSSFIVFTLTFFYTLFSGGVTSLTMTIMTVSMVFTLAGLVADPESMQ